MTEPVIATRIIRHPITGMPCGTAAPEEMDEAVSALKGKPPEDKQNRAAGILARNRRAGDKARRMAGYSAVGMVRDAG